MAEYKLLKNNYIRRNLDGACIPPDESNGDYIKYIEWTNNGGVPDPIDLDFEDTWDGVRSKRNSLLSECDWTQLSDCGLTQEVKATWILYRQQLRDIPQDYQNIEDIVWPTKP